MRWYVGKKVDAKQVPNGALLPEMLRGFSARTTDPRTAACSSLGGNPFEHHFL